MMAAAVVERFFELFADGDKEGIRELVDPDVVWLGTHGGLDARRVIRGSDALLAAIDEAENAWEEFGVEVERLIEVDPIVVAFIRETARGRTAIEVEGETAMVFKIRDERVVEGRGYLDRDAALEAAGLPPGEDRSEGMQK